MPGSGRAFFVRATGSGKKIGRAMHLFPQRLFFAALSYEEE